MLFFIDIADKQTLTQCRCLLNVLFCALEGLTTLQKWCDNERVAELVFIMPTLCRIQDEDTFDGYLLLHLQVLWLCALNNYWILLSKKKRSILFVL